MGSGKKHVGFNDDGWHSLRGAYCLMFRQNAASPRYIVSPLEVLDNNKSKKN